MPISVASRRSARGIGAPLRALVRAALIRAGRRPGEIGLVLTGDEEIRSLNRRWRKSGRAPVSGDIVISLDRTLAQARRFRVSPGRELARLVIHGALHLAGLDHHAVPERRAMRASEAAVMRGARTSIATLDRVLVRPH